MPSLDEKIRLDRSASDAVATGVQFTRNGRSEVRRAKQEVLLCARVSSHLKYVSFVIGSPRLFRSHGIDIVVENTNVGENLQDHPLSGTCIEVVDSLPTIDMI